MQICFIVGVAAGRAGRGSLGRPDANGLRWYQQDNSSRGRKGGRPAAEGALKRIMPNLSYTVCFLCLGVLYMRFHEYVCVRKGWDSACICVYVCVGKGWAACVYLCVREILISPSLR